MALCHAPHRLAAVFGTLFSCCLYFLFLLFLAANFLCLSLLLVPLPFQLMQVLFHTTDRLIIGFCHLHFLFLLFLCFSLPLPMILPLSHATQASCCFLCFFLLQLSWCCFLTASCVVVFAFFLVFLCSLNPIWLTNATIKHGDLYAWNVHG